MIGLRHQQVRPLHPGGHRLGDLAQVGDHRSFPAAAGHGVAHALHCVVGGGEGLHTQLPHLKALSRPEGTQAGLQERNPVAQLHPRAPAGIDGQGELLCEGGQARDVV